jgi:hypothetical protein
MMFMFICRLNLQTGHVQDEEEQNRNNNYIQGSNGFQLVPTQLSRTKQLQ